MLPLYHHRWRVSFTCCVSWQVRLSVSTVTSSRWPRDSSWYGNVLGGELKSPQTITAQSTDDDSSLLLLLRLLDDVDDVERANRSSSLTDNDACRCAIHTNSIQSSPGCRRRTLATRPDALLHTETGNSATLQPRYNAPRSSAVSVIALTHDRPPIFSTIFTIIASVTVGYISHTCSSICC